MNEATDYLMPAEWETHAGTWIAWPHQRADWPGKFGPIPWVYAEIVRHLAERETVHILVQSPLARERVKDILKRTGVDPQSVKLHPFRTNRCWARDFGPIFVRDAAGSRTILDWKYNAWAKYDNWQRDNAVPGKVASALALPSVQPTLDGREIVLEGGSIEVNGNGLMLTTEECLLSEIQARNPGVSREDLEGVFRRYLGIEKVLWLDEGIVGDDTHGHIDDLARFVDPTTVVIASESNEADDNYTPLRENLERLRGMTDLAGNRLNVVPLPMPDPVVFRGQRLPASYANFYIANGVVLVPTFNAPQDREALGILAEVFPGRKVVGIHCVDLVWGLGTLHCMTQQEPA